MRVTHRTFENKDSL